MQVNKYIATSAKRNLTLNFKEKSRNEIGLKSGRIFQYSNMSNCRHKMILQLSQQRFACENIKSTLTLIKYMNSLKLGLLKRKMKKRSYVPD